MYIRKIRIENIRCFGGGERRVELDLARPDGTFAGWTVVAGRNGAGKTTFLKAIALAAAGPAAARSLVPSFAGWVRKGATSGTMGVELGGFDGNDGFTGGETGPREAFWANLTLEAQPDGPEPSVMASEAGKRLTYAERGPWAENPKGWFLAGYGPYRRLSGHTADSVRLMAGPGRLARVVSLFREDASLAECVDWLRNEVYLRRLEGKPGAKQLEERVIALLNHDDLLPGGMKIHHIDSDGLWTERDGVLLPLHDLSDGYRTVIALVLDLIKQIHGCFGHFEVREDGKEKGSLFVPAAGVVLIDEMDMHLHVAWQQRIGFWLKKHFRGIQFIVTTHSPFICQAADPKGLIRLPAPGSGERAEHMPDELLKVIVNGDADAAAMTALFGLEHTHSAEAEQLRERVAELEAKLIRDKATKEEEEELARLAAELPETGSAAVERALRAMRDTG
ncbi:AAA family ATPase [Sorangium sp. So ce385]|uniref:AAA family ATPase n=1 Tax=Sorangium sp. So ce385 TaxID=3133308 RepID=UPI003F5BC9B8